MRGSQVFLLGAVLWGPASASAQTVDMAFPTIQASGTSRVSVRPTLASITFTMSATSSSASAAGEIVAARADSLRTALAALGIPGDSLISGSRWRWWQGRLTTQVSRPYCDDPSVTLNRCEQRQDTTYTVQDRVEARISNLDLLGEVVDEALRIGITEMTDFTFSAPGEVEAEDRALAEATSRARRRAEIMAETLGSQLGRLKVLTTEAPITRGYGYELGIVTMSASYTSARTEVIVPSLAITVTVYGTWEMKEQGSRD